MKPARQIIASVFLIGVLITLFYPLRAFDGGLDQGEDMLVHEIPLAVLFADTVRKGAFPLWNPYKACGVPFFEISFMGPYYPTVLLYFMLAPITAVNYGFLIHILLSGWFMLLLGREFQFSRTVSFICAVSWIFSSIFQQYSDSGWLAQAIAASYLPGIVYCFVRAMNSRYPRNIIFCLLSGLLIAFIITGGVPHYSALIIYSFLFFILPFLARTKAGRYLPFILVSGLFLSIVYWGPIALQLKGAIVNAREEIVGYSFPELGNFIFPGELRRGFAGRLVFLLGLGGLFLKGPYSRNLRALFIISLILMLAHQTIPGARLMDYVPLVNKDRYAWQWHTGLIFSLTLSAGVALKQLSHRLAARKKTLPAILGACAALQLLDLYWFHRHFVRPRGDFQFEEYYPAAPLVSYFKMDRSLFRISNEHYDFDDFRANQGLLAGISCFESRIRGINSYGFNGRNETHYLLERSPGGLMRDLCNIKYIIAQEELNDPNLARIEGIEDVYLYRNAAHYPRAFLLEGVSVARVEEALLDRYSGILLWMFAGDEARALLQNYSPVDIQWEPNRYKINYESDRGGLIFLSEMFSPGWRAAIDGSGTRIIRPFNFFMGVFVPPGKHSAIFQFRPIYFYVCAAISAAAWIIWLLMLLYFLRRRRFAAGLEGRV